MTEYADHIVLTGDRPHRAPLHLGHYAGSLRNRVALQSQCPPPIRPHRGSAGAHRQCPGSRPSRRNILEVALDYLAVGLDPALSPIVLQSGLPALSELTMLYLNLVSVARLERNPTVKAEIQLRGFERDIPAGFPLLSGQPGGGHHRLQGDACAGRRRPVADDRTVERDRGPGEQARRPRIGCRRRRRCSLRPRACRASTARPRRRNRSATRSTCPPRPRRSPRRSG